MDSHNIQLHIPVEKTGREKHILLALTKSKMIFLHETKRIQNFNLMGIVCKQRP